MNQADRLKASGIPRPAQSSQYCTTRVADLFDALSSVGYDYVVSIEHEDRSYEGSDEIVQRGFLIARGNLRPFIH